MIEKHPLDPQRVRKITGSFAFLEHRFLRDGFWSSLSQHELLLYVFLVLVADRNGLSYYSYDKICTLLRFVLDDYVVARNALIENDLVAFDGHLFQVLSLPPTPMGKSPTALQSPHEFEAADPATIRRLIRDSLGAHDD
ncbi:MAG: hypothetical protein OEU26_09790 [Candidatus Tectomicrobia bacterium]|nr:hypothetical protein [Candidatus Tectomicrobia bacterium]